MNDVKGNLRVQTSCQKNKFERRLRLKAVVFFSEYIVYQATVFCKNLVTTKI